MYVVTKSLLRLNLYTKDLNELEIQFYKICSLIVDILTGFWLESFLVICKLSSKGILLKEHMQ
jgi:hypothetical protein